MSEWKCLLYSAKSAPWAETERSTQGPSLTAAEFPAEHPHCFRGIGLPIWLFSGYSQVIQKYISTWTSPIYKNKQQVHIITPFKLNHHFQTWRSLSHNFKEYLFVFIKIVKYKLPILV